MTSPTVLTRGTVRNDYSNTVTFPSFTPGTQSALWLVVLMRRTGTTPAPVITGHGNWTVRGSITNGDDNHHLFVLSVDAGASPSNSTVFVSFGSLEGEITAAAFEVNSYDGNFAQGGRQVQFNTTLSAVGVQHDVPLDLDFTDQVDNVTLFVATTVGGGVITPKSGYTQLSTIANMDVYYRVGEDKAAYYDVDVLHYDMPAVAIELVGGTPAPFVTLDQTSCVPGNTITWTTNLENNITSASLTDSEGNVFALTNIVNNGNGTGSADVPALADGISACLFEIDVVFTVNDGTGTATDTIDFLPPVGYSLVTLSSVPGSIEQPDWVSGLSPAAAVGDQGLENHANIVHNADGTTTFSVETTYTYFVIDASNGSVTELNKTVTPPASISLDQGSCRPGDTITWTDTVSGNITSAMLIDSEGNQFALTGITNGSGIGSATIPSMSDGLSACLFDNGLTFSASNGVDTVTDSIDYLPPSGYSLTELTAVPGSPQQPDWVYNLSPAAAVGDQSIENHANITHLSNGLTSFSVQTTYTYFVVDASSGAVTEVTKTVTPAPVTITLDQASCRPGDTISWTDTISGNVTSAALIDSEGNQFPLVGITNGSGVGSATIPAIAHGLDACLFENGLTFSASNGADTATDAIDFLPPSGYELTVLASVPGTIEESDWIYDLDTPAVVGDQSIENSGDITHQDDGTTDVSVAVSYTYYLIDATDGVVTQIDKTFQPEGGPVNDVVPDSFSFTAVTNAALNQSNVESNAMTVAGVTAAVNIPVSVAGGQYAVSTDGGSTYGAFTSSASNVQLGHRIKVRGNASGNYSTATNVTLTIGGVSGAFSITTLADPGGAGGGTGSSTVVPAGRTINFYSGRTFFSKKIAQSSMDYLDYKFNLAGWLFNAGNDVVVSATPTVDAGLSIDTIEVDDDGVRFYLFGGQHGSNYKVRFLITTQLGREKQFVATMKIRNH